MRVTTWLIRKESGIRLIWPRELRVRLRRLLLNLSLINAKLIFVKLSRLADLGTE